MNHRRESAITLTIFMALLVGFSAVGYWLIFRLESATPLMMSVGFAAIVTCLIRRRDLASLGWGWGAWRYQWLSYALPLGTITAAYLLIWAGGFGEWYDASFVLEKKQDYHLDEWSNDAVILFHFLVTATLSFLLLLPSVLGEELGWRGYAQTRLQTRWNPMVAGIVVGMIWALWHLPLFLMVGTSQHELNMPFVGFFFGLMAHSILYAWLQNHTDNSIWTAIFFHWIFTYAAQVTATGVTRSALYNWLEYAPYIILAIVIALIWNKEIKTR